MAIRYAVASGNWSAVGTWDGGVALPASGDDVYANGFTVSINQSVTVNSLKKIANGSPVIAAGGQFNITTAATVTVTAGIAAADGVTNSSYILGVNAGSAAVTITAAGGITGGGATARVAVSILSGQTGTVTVNAALTGGAAANCFAVSSAATTGALVIVGNIAGSSSSSGAALNISGTSSLAVTGTVTGGSGVSAFAANLAGTSTVTVTGAVTGGSTTTAHAINAAASGCTLAVTGAISGGTSSTACGIGVSSGTLSVTATGGVTGGTASSNHGILVSSGATLTVNSALTGGTLGNAVNVASGGVATIRGGATASTGAAAVDSSGSCRISGALAHASNSRAPIVGLWTVIAGEETTMSLFNDSAFPASNAGSAVVLNLLGTSNPSPADVRYGTTYGASGGSTGTLRVPPAASVASGVLTDNTTGTAALSLSDVAAVTGAQIAAAL